MRPLPLVLRTWTWRFAAVLAVAAVALGAVLVHELDEERVDRPAWLDEVAPTSCDAQPATLPGPAFSLAEIRQITRGWMRWGSAQDSTPLPAEAPPAASTLLPLRAFSLSLWIHFPTGPDTVLLRSKDPAHPESYCPREGEPDRGVALVSIERDRGVARITVSRGQDVHVFVTGDVGRGSEALAEVRLPLGPVVGADPLRSEGMAHDVKVVPFRGTDGQVVGARVTGIRPGSWFERAGLRPGDLVRGVNGREVVATGVLIEEAARGRLVSLRVERERGGGHEVLDLGS